MGKRQAVHGIHAADICRPRPQLLQLHPPRQIGCSCLGLSAGGVSAADNHRAQQRPRSELSTIQSPKHGDAP